MDQMWEEKTGGDGRKRYLKCNLSWQSKIVCLYAIAIAGKPFLDFSLVALDSKQEMRLSDLVKKAGVRPLILNFGSCSWPPFMEKLGAFEAVADKEFSDLWINFPQYYVFFILNNFHCYQFLLSPTFGRDHATPPTDTHECSIKIFTESSLKSH